MLLTVWVLVLLSVLCGSALLISRGEALRARQLQYQAQGRAAADGGMRIAVDALIRTTGEPLRQLERNGIALTLEAFEVAVSIERESGKVDLNNARADLIAALLNQFAVPGTRLVGPDAVEQWRGAHRLKASPGRAFGRAAALLSLPGADRATLDCALPYVTVHISASEPDPGYAEQAVIAAMRTYREVREVQAAGDSHAAGHAYALTARATRKEPEVAVQRQAIVRLTGNPNAPVLFYDWQTTYPPKSSPCSSQ